MNNKYIYYSLGIIFLYLFLSGTMFMLLEHKFYFLLFIMGVLCNCLFLGYALFVYIGEHRRINK